MSHKKNIVWFEEVGKHDVGLVGGKGANLGEMTNANLPIPYGFVVTSNAYFDFLKESNLSRKIKEIISITNCDNPHELKQSSEHIQSLIRQSEMPVNIVKEIVKFYDLLCLKEETYLTKKMSFLRQVHHHIKHLYKQPLVAVRSSATAEDLPNASFAGQQDTYLNVRGETHLLKKVKDCWASLFTERAIYYRHEQGFDHFRVGLAAVVQRMVESEKSGIAFSIDPVTNDKNKIVIEAIFGLGEYIVQGKVTPDHYEVDKRSFVILKKDIQFQNLKFIKAGVGNQEIRLNKGEGYLPKLTDKEIIDLALVIKEIEHHYFFPQDIEWAIEAGKTFIVQSRPITTIKKIDNEMKNENSEFQSATAPTPILTGAPASPGIAVGPVKIIPSPRQIDRVKKGDILVAPQTNPDYVPAMKKAAAIVTERGGRTSHAAIVSRELGLPAVVGTEKATTKLKDNMIISVNGSTGEIFKGAVYSTKKLSSQTVHHYKKYHTLTKVYVNLAEVEKAESIAKRDVDGIGLLRAEFMIADIGTHPKEYIRLKKEHIFINMLATDMLKFVKPFTPRQVVYRATDFKTNEYVNLKGGKRYEPHEENPMLGYRGASRYIANPDIFGLELLAIRKVWDMGYRNLHLMIPFVRAPWEVIKIKEIVKSYGLFDLPGFKFWIMVEVPSCALSLTEFIKVGIDGVSIGTNDLTMMLMGVDRDNPEVANIYDERTPIVESTLEYIVKTCSANGITCSICGQAASDYPDLVEKLVKAGITSVSVNPDAIERTRELIYHIEKKHFDEIKKNK